MKDPTNLKWSCNILLPLSPVALLLLLLLLVRVVPSASLFSSRSIFRCTKQQTSSRIISLTNSKTLDTLQWKIGICAAAGFLPVRPDPEEMAWRRRSMDQTTKPTLVLDSSRATSDPFEGKRSNFQNKPYNKQT